MARAPQKDEEIWAVSRDNGLSMPQIIQASLSFIGTGRYGLDECGLMLCNNGSQLLTSFLILARESYNLLGRFTTSGIYGYTIGKSDHRNIYGPYRWRWNWIMDGKTSLNEFN
jgi:hypothetical protein